MRRGAVLAVGVPGGVARSARANPRRTLVSLTTAVVVFALTAGVFVLLAERRSQVEAAGLMRWPPASDR